MPIKIPNELPAKKTLESENIFVMTDKKAAKQDIRPLRIILLNLMPTKIVTETQILRLLGNTPLQVEVHFMTTKSYTSKNTPSEHLVNFYETFDAFKDQKFDGLIITGAPVENLAFEDVDYWEEICEIMEWSKTHVYSTFHICWGAQAGLYYHYGIQKYPLPEKMFGIFRHKVNKPTAKLMRGFNDYFNAPHSRHSEVRTEDIRQNKKLEILSSSKEAGVYIAASKDGRQIFVTGHSEYDANTLALEYERDISRGLNIKIPVNYYPEDNPKNKPVVSWRAHANLLFSNWLNYYVYQTTPYDVTKIK